MSILRVGALFSEPFLNQVNNVLHLHLPTKVSYYIMIMEKKWSDVQYLK